MVIILQLRSIPTVGPSGTLSSYIGAVRFLLHGREMLQEGYNKYRGSFFKIPTLTSWIIIASGGPLIDEIRRAPNNALSATAAIREVLLTDLTVGPEQFDDPFNAEVIKGPLTRNIGAKFPDIQDEIAAAFEEYVPVKGDEWTKVKAYTTIMNVVCRTSNRMLVGLPLCRDPDWIQLNKQFALDIIKGTVVLNFIPDTLTPIVAPFLRGIPRGIQRATKCLESLIRERLEQEAQHGDGWSDKPNDVISWMLHIAKGQQRSIQDLVKSVLIMNFAALHTTTVCTTYVMYTLATHPEYIQPLRDEIEALIEGEGLSKDAINKLWKADSFIKECLRMHEFTLLTMRRKALKDFTFSDGTTIPADCIINFPYHPIHADAAKCSHQNIYTNPEIFDGFRFEKMRVQGSEGAKNELVSIGLDYILFGSGRHACPGRFFVATEIKLILAYVLLNYDIEMEDGHPRNWQFWIHSGPDMTAKIRFGKRQGEYYLSPRLLD
ncbi:Cytochrome P450 [Amanita muscaria]